MSEISKGMPQNEVSSRPNRTHSNFPLTYKNLQTQRFGELTPHWIMEGVEDDSLPYSCEHNVRSYTLKAPLMEDITMHKDYFMVPKEAILPLNWQKFYKNPVQGDDIDPLEVGCTVNIAKYSWRAISNLQRFSSLIEDWSDYDQVDVEDYLTQLFPAIILAEYLFSRGSLLNMLGAKGLCDQFKYEYTADSKSYIVGFDHFEDDLLRELSRTFSYFTATVDSNTWVIRLDSEPRSANEMSLRQFLEVLRDDCHDLVISNPVRINAHISSLNDIIDGIQAPIQEDFKYEINLFRLWSYQLVCATYYTNEQVDYVYNADLFREYVLHCVKEAYTASFTTQFEADMWFSYNGIKYLYDNMSAHWFNKVFDRLFDSDYNFIHNQCLPYVQSLFSIHRSLRFVDYFTGARSHPLAVQGTGYNINGPFTDVIDITKKIQFQRFYNAVNRTVHKFSDSVAGYVKGLFGISQAPDYHNPFYLASTQDKVFNVENENTAEAQMTEKYSVTSVLRSQSDRYVFQFHPDRRCILLGITWYDIPRAYINSTEKFHFHENRYDMFNLYLQYTGDVPLPAQCKQALNAQGESNYGVSFGYTSPYMEYKQRFNQASGGFADGESLPGWAFIADEGYRNYDAEHISPNYIRSSPSELDKFYVSLTGYSLATYFHFAIVFTNKMDANRPMAFDPQILM